MHRLTEQANSLAQNQNRSIYFPVSTAKFILLSVCTCGFYELYWFYNQWKGERTRGGQPLSPFWRTVFAPIFAYSLFRRIKEFGQSSAVPVRYSPAALACTFWALSLSSSLPDPVWMISFLSFLPLLPVCATVAAINRKYAPDSDTNASFSGANLAVAICGAFFVILGVLGTLIPNGAH